MKLSLLFAFERGMHNGKGLMRRCCLRAVSSLSLFAFLFHYVSFAFLFIQLLILPFVSANSDFPFIAETNPCIRLGKRSICAPVTGTRFPGEFAVGLRIRPPNITKAVLVSIIYSVIAPFLE